MFARLQAALKKLCPIVDTKQFLGAMLLVGGMAIGTAAQAGAGCGDGASSAPANPQLTSMAIASVNATLETLNKTEDSVVLISPAR